MDLAVKSDVLSEIASVSHGFFTRNGGVSEGIYASLNCGYGSRDSADNVQKNRLIVLGKLSAKEIVTLHQTHSSKAVCVNEKPQEPVEADAIITNKRGLAIGILTADCAPILFADERAGIIAAAHAGWKGAAGGVIQNTIDSMLKMGAVRQNIMAAIGPCIGKCSYEVDEIFYKKHVRDNIENRRFFDNSEVNIGRYHYDLAGYIASQLEACGVGAIDNLDIDTYTNEDDFYSYRRSTHKYEDDYGRQISAISLK